MAIKGRTITSFEAEFVFPGVGAIPETHSLATIRKEAFVSIDYVLAYLERHNSAADIRPEITKRHGFTVAFALPLPIAIGRLNSARTFHLSGKIDVYDEPRWKRAL